MYDVTIAAGEAVLLRAEGLRIEADGADRPLVDGVSVTLRRGHTVGIVGESGSGKSLTCRALLGILPPGVTVTAGSVEFDGVDVTGFGAKEWMPLRGARVAAIFQDPASYLNPSVRVGKQLTEVLRVRGGLDSDDAYDRAIALFRQVGLRDPESVYRKYPFELSGGMAQRVVIAIAVSLTPEVLIADEATTALDVTVQAEVLRLLARLKDEFHLSLVFVSHDLALVQQVADHVIVLRDGVVVEEGATSDVLHRPQHEYTRLLIRDHLEYGLESYLTRGAR